MRQGREQSNFRTSCGVGGSTDECPSDEAVLQAQGKKGSEVCFIPVRIAKTKDEQKELTGAG